MGLVPVPSDHFRLIYAHASLTMPTATIFANDDIELATVAPGAHASLDHPLMPPHQANQLLKVHACMHACIRTIRNVRTCMPASSPPPSSRHGSPV